MKAFLRSAALPIALLTAPMTAAMSSSMAVADTYQLDASHSQIVFSYNHLGFSTTYGMFSGFDGRIVFEKENPAASSVEVSFPVRSMMTGWEGRFAHFMSADFFGAGEDDMVSFASTSIEVTGENTALITGNLTLNDITREVVLDAKLNAAGMHPMENKEWLGFDATATLLRSDYELGAFAPFVSDEVQLVISIEAIKAE